MIPEFNFDPEAIPTQLEVEAKRTSNQDAKLDRLSSLILKPEERDRLERLLLSRLAERKAQLDTLWTELNGHWGYEDGFYRFYQGVSKSIACSRARKPQLRSFAHCCRSVK
jgi:hypothetical protein